MFLFQISGLSLYLLFVINNILVMNERDCLNVLDCLDTGKKGIKLKIAVFYKLISTTLIFTCCIYYLKSKLI